MVAKLDGPQFSGGANIAIKCPSHTYEQLVGFYRDTLALPLLEEEPDGCIFQFGPNRLWIDKTEVRRGEEIEMQAFARNDNGSEFVERIPLVIPADAPIGPLVIIVGDGASLNQADRSQPSADVSPRDLGQLVRAINKLKAHRAVATRYDKRAANFLGAIYLAASLTWLN